MPRLTKTAAIFGPNASGKTNFLIALRWMRDLVLHSTSYTDARFAETYTPFATANADGSPTLFGIELLLGGVRYQYSFSYDAQGITAESLYVNLGRKAQRWFERRRNKTGTETWAPFSPRFDGPREQWRKMTHSRGLFLLTAGRGNSLNISNVLRWIERDLHVVLSSDPVDPSAFAMRVHDPQFKARALGIFHAIDIPIDDARPTAGAVLAHRSPLWPHGSSSIEFLHRRKGQLPVWLDFAHEASGIRRLVHILAPLLDAIENGSFLAIDEVNRSLHPLVARFLIQLINDPSSSRRYAQLMVNTHTTRLMDLEILRRDEIWLMELAENHATRLTPLSEQSPRKHERIAKNYLQGSFGAVPAIRPDKWHEVVRPRLSHRGLG